MVYDNQLDFQKMHSIYMPWYHKWVYECLWIIILTDFSENRLNSFTHKFLVEFSPKLSLKFKVSPYLISSFWIIIQGRRRGKIFLNICTIVHFFSKSVSGKVNFLIDLGHCQIFKPDFEMNCNTINILSNKWTLQNTM